MWTISYGVECETIFYIFVVMQLVINGELSHSTGVSEVTLWRRAILVQSDDGRSGLSFFGPIDRNRGEIFMCMSC